MYYSFFFSLHFFFVFIGHEENLGRFFFCYMAVNRNSCTFACFVVVVCLGFGCLCCLLCLKFVFVVVIVFVLVFVVVFVCVYCFCHPPPFYSFQYSA